MKTCTVCGKKFGLFATLFGRYTAHQNKCSEEELRKSLRRKSLRRKKLFADPSSNILKSRPVESQKPAELPSDIQPSQNDPLDLLSIGLAAAAAYSIAGEQSPKEEEVNDGNFGGGGASGDWSQSLSNDTNSSSNTSTESYASCSSGAEPGSSYTSCDSSFDSSSSCSCGGD